MGSLFLVSQVSSSVRVYPGHVLLAYYDKKCGTQKPHPRIIATNGKNSPPYTSRSDIIHGKYSNFYKLTMNVNHITSEAMTNQQEIARKSFVFIYLSFNRMNDITTYVTRGSISLINYYNFRAASSGLIKQSGSARTDNQITPHESRESPPGEHTAEEPANVAPDGAPYESLATVRGDGGGRDGNRPLAPYETLTEERKKEIKRQKNRRHRLARTVRSRAARAELRDEARTGLSNLSITSNFTENSAGTGANAGEHEALGNHSSPPNQQVASAPNSRDTPQQPDASAVDRQSAPQQRPATTAINSRSSRHQDAIRGKTPLQLRPPTTGDGHISTYEVNLLLINSGRHLGRYVFETRPGGTILVFFEISHLEEARTILEGAGYGVGAPAASHRQMSLVVPRQLVPPTSLPAPESQRRLKEVPGVINNYNLGLGMPASSITYRGHKVEQFADVAGALRTRVRVWVNVTESGVTYLDTVGNTLHAGSAMVSLRPAGGQPQTTPASVPVTPRSPHRSDNS